MGKEHLRTVATNERIARKAPFAMGKSWALLQYQQRQMGMAKTLSLLHHGRPVHTDYRGAVSNAYA